MADPSPERGARPRVAIDGLGAELGPAVVVEAAKTVAAEGIELRVFGRPDELSALEGVSGVEVIAATERITNDDDPVSAVRGRPGASVVMAAADVAEGNSDALVSPGSTGATMAAALFAMRRMRGVLRPALAVQFPHPDRPLLMLDGGANSDARPQHLIQFAYLGAAFAEAVLDLDQPRVALLSVGEEAKKGTSTVVEAHDALLDGELNFAGNVEGRDLFEDVADVVVTDGFTGNIVLKTVEGTARAFAAAVSNAQALSRRASVGGRLMRRELDELHGIVDPDSTGGAMLLGLRGVTVVGHGSSSARGLENAARVAARAVTEDAIGRTAELLARSGATRSMLRDRKAEMPDPEDASVSASTPAPAK
ncbi:MAG: phosphate acyltransferase PlsX [Solirubrobacterales bacterium]